MAANDESTVPQPSDPGSDPAPFKSGTTLGDRYRIVTFLGGGAMGNVYRADDLRLKQPVALKFMKPGADAATLERLYAEVRLGRAIAHENVCRIYDVAEVQATTCIAMEFVVGGDLGSLLERIKRLAPDTALDFARQICAGLAAIHEKGVVHRDLKPRNVLLDERGRVRITDFGLAVAATDPQKRSISGTPEYMAPEQFSGEVSERSDIYAVGLILYELLTGERVRHRRTYAAVAETRSRVLQNPPSTIVPSLDPRIDRIILQCLEDDPPDRPLSAHALLVALTQYESPAIVPLSNAGAKIDMWQPKSHYDALINDIQQAVFRRLPILITGGRGVGKTFVLSRLTLDTNTLIVSFRDVHPDDAMCSRLMNHHGALCIDDFDEAFSPRQQALLESLVQRRPYPTVITSTITPDISMLASQGAFSGLPWDLESIECWSSITAQMQPFHLDPRGPGWKRRLASHLETILDSSAADQDVSGWATILIDLTGGHPTMLDAALRELWKESELRRGQPPALPIGVGGSDWLRRSIWMEEQLFATGLRRLRGSVTWLEMMDPGSSEYLRQIARGELNPTHLPVQIRRVFLHSGLAYRTSSQDISISGQVLCQYLAGQQKTAVRPLEAIQTDNGGELRVRVAGSVFTLFLRGASWLVADQLLKSERSLPIDELSYRTQIHEGTVRSAITRIRNEFSSLGVENVIENNWGEGYRFGDFPIFSPSALRD